MHLLDDIEAFCATHGLSWSRFGTLAVGDTSFVFGMRGEVKGRPRRSPKLDTVIKIQQFMRDYENGRISVTDAEDPDGPGSRDGDESHRSAV